MLYILYLGRHAQLWLVVLFCFVSQARADNYYKIREFTLADGLTQEHFGDIIQDTSGYLWIASWTGLVRYDGYRFDTFKPSDKPTSTNRILNMRMGTDGQKLYCETYNRRIYVFDIRKCRFTQFLDKRPAGWPNSREFVRLESYKATESLKSKYAAAKSFSVDREGDVWIRTDRSLAMMSVHERFYEWVDPKGDGSSRAFLVDRKKRLWQGYKSGLLKVGRQYLSSSGRLSDRKVAFSHRGIYAIHETADGRIFVGTKGDGLFVLKPDGDIGFSVVQFRHDPNNPQSLRSNCIYDIAQDVGKGGVCIATWGGGVCLFDGSTRFKRLTDGFDGEAAKARSVAFTTDGTLVVGTADGLVVVSDMGRCRRLLIGSDVMGVTVKGNRLFVAVYGAGLFEFDLNTIWLERPRFKDYHIVGNDYSNIVSMIRQQDILWLFSELSVVRLSLRNGVYTVLDVQSLGERIFFTEAVPALISQGRIVVGTERGAMLLDTRRVGKRPKKRHIFITGIQYQGDNYFHSTNDIDTLVVNPDRRSFALSLSTLDLGRSKQIGFMYRMDGVDNDWNYLLQSNTLRYSGLQPGKYVLRIKSSSANGFWFDNERRLVVEVVPTLRETSWFKILLILGGFSIAGGILLVWLHVRKMHIRQRQLEAYCKKLLAEEKGIEPKENRKATMVEAPEMSDSDKDFLDRFLSFFNRHLSDCDVTVADYAQALNMSHSAFYRRVKQLTGTTPVEFVNSLRVQAATKLFDDGERMVAEVAYKTGFSDPKYFSKCFKKKVGLSPSEYIKQMG